MTTDEIATVPRLVKFLNEPRLTLAEIKGEPDPDQLKQIRDTRERTNIIEPLIGWLNASSIDTRAIDAILKGYVVAVPSTAGRKKRGWNFRWTPDRDMIQFYHDRSTLAAKRGEDPYGTANPETIDRHIRQARRILSIIRLANNEKLYRVRRCEHCQRWFEGPINKRFCGRPCVNQANYKPIATLSGAKKSERREAWRDSSEKYRKQNPGRGGRKKHGSS